MPKTLKDLSQGGKEELALALLLWKDFKSQGKPADKAFDVTRAAIEMAMMLGIQKEFNEMMPKLPPLVFGEKHA